jgi:hypothetical protein
MRKILILSLKIGFLAGISELSAPESVASLSSAQSFRDSSIAGSGVDFDVRSVLSDASQVSNVSSLRRDAIKHSIMQQQQQDFKAQTQAIINDLQNKLKESDAKLLLIQEDFATYAKLKQLNEQLKLARDQNTSSLTTLYVNDLDAFARAGNSMPKDPQAIQREIDQLKFNINANPEVLQQEESTVFQNRNALKKLHSQIVFAQNQQEDAASDLLELSRRAIGAGNTDLSQTVAGSVNPDLLSAATSKMEAEDNIRNLVARRNFSVASLPSMISSYRSRAGSVASAGSSIRSDMARPVVPVAGNAVRRNSSSQDSNYGVHRSVGPVGSVASRAPQGTGSIHRANGPTRSLGGRR